MSARHAERERRTSLRKEAKKAAAKQLAQTLLDADVDQEDLAEVLGTSPSIVQRMCDQKRLETLSLADIKQMGDERGDSRMPDVARAMLAWAARRVGLEVVTKLRAVAPADEHHTHLAKRMRENAESVAAHMEALADGVIDDGELARIDRELRGSEEANAEARAWVEDEKQRRRGAA